MLIAAVMEKGQVRLSRQVQQEVSGFRRLADTLFGGEYHYVPEKSDREILGEVLSEKHA